MLAPANFGSALAHKGRSMLGRVFKGWKTGFETGEEMLYALELASPFQWDLAQADLFVPEGKTPQSSPALQGTEGSSRTGSRLAARSRRLQLSSCRAARSHRGPRHYCSYQRRRYEVLTNMWAAGMFLCTRS